MSEKCRVCGSEDVSRWHSGRIGPLVYCSGRCARMGNRYLNLTIFIIFFILGLALIGSGLSQVFSFIIILIFVVIYFLIITINGFLAKRNYEREKTLKYLNFSESDLLDVLISI